MDSDHKLRMMMPGRTFTRRIWSWSIRKGILAFVVILGIIPLINAQSSGSRGGVRSNQYGGQTQPDTLIHQRVEDYITIASKVELRVKPDQIRIVLAVGANARTSAECEKNVFSKIDELKSALVEIGVRPENIVDDFIAVLPRYQYEVKDQEKEKVAVETLLDFSMQSNLHIKVPNDELAIKSIRAAFRLDITDIIAFDYWSTELDQTKEMALDQATEQAKRKAQILLGQTFDVMPKPINVEATTQIILPDSLYDSFSNTHSQTLTQPYRGNLPTITAFRPKNTYYKGHVDLHADRQPKTVSMRCEISVVSSVQLFFASPVSERLLATKQVNLKKSRDKKKKKRRRPIQ